MAERIKLIDLTPDQRGIIKTITITCGQCSKPYELDESNHYVDVMHDVEGWGARCPHCKGSNMIEFKLVRAMSESREERKKRIGTPIKDALEEVVKRYGWDQNDGTE